MKTKIMTVACDPRNNLGLNQEIIDLVETIKKIPDRDRVNSQSKPSVGT